MIYLLVTAVFIVSFVLAFALYKYDLHSESRPVRIMQFVVCIPGLILLTVIIVIKELCMGFYRMMRDTLHEFHHCCHLLRKSFKSVFSKGCK